MDWWFGVWGGCGEFHLVLGGRGVLRHAGGQSRWPLLSKPEGKNCTGLPYRLLEAQNSRSRKRDILEMNPAKRETVTAPTRCRLTSMQRGRIMIATAFVLVNVEMGMARDVYRKMQEVRNIQNLDGIAGPYDIVAVVQGSDFNEIARVVIDEIQTIDGVSATITCNTVNFEV